MITRACALSALTLVGCAATDTTETSRAAIVEGEVHPGDPAVVAIAMRRAACDAPPPTPHCTGTLIHPRVVLTAAHCLQPRETGVAYEILFGASNTARDAQLRIVTTYLIHPDHDPKTHAFDLALLRLADDAPVAPIPVSTKPPAVGTTVRVIGYGLTADRAVPAGTKRSGLMTITSVAATTFRAEPSPSNTCRADSGGPVLAGETLVGVTVSGDPACSEYALNGRVDVAAPIMDAFLTATDVERRTPRPGVIGHAQICSVDCVTDASCPAGLQCQSTPAGKRCVVPGLGPGALGARCGDGSGCAPGSVCARLETAGDGACMCHTPCLEPERVAASGGGSCTTIHRPMTGEWALLIVAVGGAITARRTNRRSSLRG